MTTVVAPSAAWKVGDTVRVDAQRNYGPKDSDSGLAWVREVSEDRKTALVEWCVRGSGGDGAAAGASCYHPRSRRGVGYAAAKAALGGVSVHRAVVSLRQRAGAREEVVWSLGCGAVSLVEAAG